MMLVEEEGEEGEEDLWMMAEEERGSMNQSIIYFQVGLSGKSVSDLRNDSAGKFLRIHSCGDW